MGDKGGGAAWRAAATLRDVGGGKMAAGSGLHRRSECTSPPCSHRLCVRTGPVQVVVSNSFPSSIVFVVVFLLCFVPIHSITQGSSTALSVILWALSSRGNRFEVWTIALLHPILYHMPVSSLSQCCHCTFIKNRTVSNATPPWRYDSQRGFVPSRVSDGQIKALGSDVLDMHIGCTSWHAEVSAAAPPPASATAIDAWVCPLTVPYSMLLD